LRRAWELKQQSWKQSAVVQTLADPDSMEETRKDGVNTSIQDEGPDTARLEAAERSRVGDRLRALVLRFG
jgi:hypothetical protein